MQHLNFSKKLVLKIVKHCQLLKQENYPYIGSHWEERQIWSEQGHCMRVRWLNVGEKENERHCKRSTHYCGGKNHARNGIEMYLD